jgi:uncharacterized protein YacL
MSDLSARTAAFLRIEQPDARLAQLAEELGGAIVTNDATLRRAAEARGVPVHSIDALSAALQPGPRPGDEMVVTLTREGKEPGQGIAYLDDGTMVVVERASRHIGAPVAIRVGSTLQMAGGRMIFGNLKSPDLHRMVP